MHVLILIFVVSYLFYAASLRATKRAQTEVVFRKYGIAYPHHKRYGWKFFACIPLSLVAIVVGLMIGPPEVKLLSEENVYGWSAFICITNFVMPYYLIRFMFYRHEKEVGEYYAAVQDKAS